MKKDLLFSMVRNVVQKAVNIRMIGLVLLGVFLLGLNTPDAFSQTKRDVTITGVVKDTKGEILPGVGIIIMGTTKGTITDFEGRFVITAPEDAKLQFNFIGFKDAEIFVNGRTKIDVVLEEEFSDLDEVVVVGYGSQKAKNVTGAVETVQMDEIESLPVSNLSEALKGQIPSLNVTGGSQRPGEAASLSIRQTYSWSKDGGSEVPLVVIDGIIQLDPNTGLPTLDQFNMLDPSEIESISVLKDASAAIYGSRASQGAIIVTTKRGKKGNARISYSGQFGVNDAVSHGKTLTGSDYGNYANTLLNDWDVNEDYLFSKDELYEMSKLDYNWLDKAWKPSVTQRHSLGVSGGTDNVTYYAGASIYDQGANLGSQDYERWNFRSNLGVKLTSSLKLNANLSANKGAIEKSYTKSSASINSDYANGSRADYGILLHMPRYIPWSVDYNGEEEWFSPFVGPNVSNTSGMINSRASVAGWNYFANDEAGSKSYEESMAYSANFELAYDVPFVKGLKLRGTYAVNQSYTETDQVQMAYDLVYQTDSKSAGNHLYSIDADLAVGTNEYQDLVMYDSNYIRNTQMNFFLNYDREFGNHNISVMGSIEKAKGYKSFKRIYYEDPSYPYLGDSSTAGTLTDNTYTRKYNSGSLSYLGRVNYDYLSKYIFQFLFRYDASTKFAPENYWGFFPSASAGWVMSSEDWFQNALPWVDFFKVRYSFGLTGKDNIRAWAWLQTYTYSNDEGYSFGDEGGELNQSLEFSATPNRNVKWDKTYKHNVGIDTKVLSNRLGFNVDFYYDKSRDMLMSLASEVGVPITAGGAYAEENYGAIDSWGYEVQTSWRDNITSDLSYSIGINFGKGYNKVKKYVDQGVNYEASNVTQVGKSTIMPTWGFHTWDETSGGDGILRTDDDVQNYWNYLTENAGTDGAPQYFEITDLSDMKKGMLAYKDVGGTMNEDGTQNGPNGVIEEEQDYVKLVDANKAFGFNTSLGINYKSLSFRTQIATSWGEARFIDRVDANKPSSNYSLWSPESFWSDMYSEDDPTAGKYPLASYSDNFYNSNMWLVSGFRCYVRNIRLSYALPKRIIEPLNIDKIALGVEGTNLWDFYNPFPKKYRNMYDSSTTGYPTLRTWSFSVNVTF